MSKTHIVSPSTIRALWNEWAMAFGAMSVVMLFPLVMSKRWVPFVVLGIAYLLNVYLRNERAKEKIKSCPLIVRASMVTLFWSAVIMIVINLIFVKWSFASSFDVGPYNPKHPYICSLIIYPVGALVSLYMNLAGHKLKYCRRCRARYGYYPSDGIVSTLFFKESRYQLTLMFWLSLAVGVVNVMYYFVFYINVNFNSPDRFFFIIMPMAVYALSVIYVTSKYVNMSEHITRQFAGKPLRPIISVVRFMVFADDAILLGRNQDFFLDTPAAESVPRVDTMSIEKARKDFEAISGITDFEAKYIYSDVGYSNGANVIHFAVFLPDRIEISKIGGRWCTIDEIDRQLKAGKLDPMLAGEILHIYNVTMAWKTYDRNGKRLYPIKNYHPTFRIRDFKTWDVDYDDRHWLEVASNNEDKFFFKLRRFWRKNFMN